MVRRQGRQLDRGPVVSAVRGVEYCGLPEHLLDEWVRPVVAGTKTACFALTEPDSGSDPAAGKMLAEKLDDGWRLTGTKLWISNGSISDWAKEAAATATENGIMKGYPDNTFQPQGSATRAEAVTVIVNAIK